MKPGTSWAAGCASLAGTLALTAFATQVQAAPQYRIAQEISLPGDGGWDDLTFDDGGHRLFIAHGTQVQVVDTDKLALAGSIADTPGVHAPHSPPMSATATSARAAAAPSWCSISKRWHG